MISNNTPLQAVSYLAMSKVSTGGRAYVPVARNQVLYSHFKYVSGFADSENIGTVGIDKLRILNSILDQLVSMKTNEAQKADFLKTNAERINNAITENTVDALVTYYDSEIKNIIAQTENIGYGGIPERSAILDLTA